MAERIDLSLPQLFISSPGDLLAHYCAQQIALVPQFKKLFGEFIDGYLRMDYGIRNLPALRIYQEEPYEVTENWFMNGQLEVDILLPPSLRREQLHIISDQISGALFQQFRRLGFFTTMRGLVPGLNYLGQHVIVSKNRAFQLEGDELIPLATMSVNFRVDLREWDLYLEQSDRTVDDPFVRTLGNLETICTTLAALDPLSGQDAGVDGEFCQPVGPPVGPPPVVITTVLTTEGGLDILTESGEDIELEDSANP